MHSIHYSIKNYKQLQKGSQLSLVSTVSKVINEYKPPNIIQKLQSNFHFNRDHLKQIFKLPHSIVVESYLKAFQYKSINSILYTNTKL